MYRQRKKKVPALGIALIAGLLVLLGMAFMGHMALAGFIIACGVIALVACAFFMGQRGVHAEIEYNSAYLCYGENPCGHHPEKSGCGSPCAREPAPQYGSDCNNGCQHDVRRDRGGGTDAPEVNSE